VLAKNPTTIAITLPADSIVEGHSIAAGATLNGTAETAGGTVVYTFYASGDCSGADNYAGTRRVDAGLVPNSLTIRFATPGTYSWQVVYRGDADNASATSACLSMTVTA
jgi:hypothetical protein